MGPGRYSPPRVSETEKIPVFGAPVEELVSTSYIERQNLTMRMGMRRFTRLTNGFSKKIENHCAAVALHLARYKFRSHAPHASHHPRDGGGRRAHAVVDG